MSAAVNPATSEGENVPEIQALTQRVLNLNEGTDWWNGAMILALILAALAAIAVVGTTIMALKRAKQAGNVQAELIRAKDEQLALNLRVFDGELTKAKTALADREADNLDLRRAMQPRRLHARRNASKADTELKLFSGMFVRVQSASDSEPTTLASDIRAALRELGIASNAPQDSWFTVPSRIRPAIEVWTADPTLPGMLPQIQAFANRASALGDALVVWLRSNGMHSVERRFNPHSQAEFDASPWESNLIPVDQAAIIVGAVDINREVEALRAARKPVAPTIPK